MIITPLRNEIKFIAEVESYDLFLSLAKTHELAFYQEYPDRWINNIYYDNYNLDSYLQNVEGDAKRQKVRWRWYGEDFSHSQGTLEVKRRDGNLGNKFLFPTQGTFFKNSNSLGTFNRELRRNLSPEGRIFLDTHNQAVFFNRYKRHYFRSRYADIRLTLDSPQVVCNLLQQRSLSQQNLENNVKNLVIELKFPTAENSNAQKILPYLRPRSGRYSKYVAGLSNF